MRNLNKRLTLGIPNGSLQEYILRIFKEAGFDVTLPMEGYILKIDDPEIECLLLNHQWIPKYVEKGKLDLGVSGDDWILESGAKIIEVSNLGYDKREMKKVKWVLAVPKDSKIKRVQDLEGKTISTKIVNLTKNYLKKNKVRAKVEFSWNTTEPKLPRFADAIVDIIKTGVSLKAHNLKVLGTIIESSTKLITNRIAWQAHWKKEKIEHLALLLQGAVMGERVVNLTMYVPGEELNRVSRVLLKLHSPTIRKTAGENWYDVSIHCKEKNTRTIIPKLKKLGCKDIIQRPIIKWVP